MWTPGVVVACALALLGRSEESLPAIEFIEKAPPGVSSAAEGYTLLGEQRIVLITSSRAFREAQQSPAKCDQTEALRQIAGVIVHEEWHVHHGADENGAYDAQLRALFAAGAGVTSSLFLEVRHAQQLVNTRSRAVAITKIASINPKIDESVRRQ
jgi:hypothetical protein